MRLREILFVAGDTSSSFFCVQFSFLLVVIFMLTAVCRQRGCRAYAEAALLEGSGGNYVLVAMI